MTSAPVSVSPRRIADHRTCRGVSADGEFYVVENKQTTNVPDGEETQANNLAYTGLPLQFHTDLPHYASPPQARPPPPPPLANPPSAPSCCRLTAAPASRASSRTSNHTSSCMLL
jgi:hypothetical protein